MLQALVSIQLGPRVKYLITGITWIAEDIRKVMRLHMVPGAGTVLVGKLFTDRTVEPSVVLASVDKLEQFLGILELSSWGGLFLLNENGKFWWVN